MPKTLLQIKNFNLGIITAVDESDIPDGGLANVTNLMCDVPGKVRPMGSDKIHDDLSGDISATITPGYGLFAYRSDYRVSDDSPNEAKILAFQNVNGIGFYDIESTADLLQLGRMSSPCQPVFYYTSIDGALRVCDSNFNNINYVADGDDVIGTFGTPLDPDSHTFVKYLKFINKTWFHNGVTYHGDGDEGNDPNEHGFATHDFSGAGYTYGLDAYIYPPTVAATAVALNGTVGAEHNLCHQAVLGDADAETAVTVAHLKGDDLGGANVAIKIGHTTDALATWLADTEMRFGISFMYEGDQESSITDFSHQGANTGTSIAADGYSLDITIYASTIGWDPRIKGVNVYYVGDTTGDFNDPKRLLEFYFGSSEFDPPKIKASDGQTIEASGITVDNTNFVAFNQAAIKIMHEPSVTYEFLNGYKHNTETLAATYKTVSIVNRRAYIGGVRRIKFNPNTIADSAWQEGQNEAYKQPEIIFAQPTAELDTIYMSPVEKFDIFPKENYISIGANDGEHIVALVEFADRLLQFKQNKLYIINLSQDYEYLEAEHDYIGIQYPYQVIRTEKGIAWTNANGCYLYDGEKITNLIDGKLHRTRRIENHDDVEGWLDFTNNTGMIGYVPVSEQLVIFENPEASSVGSAGNAFIYSFITESWTRALNVLSMLPKSNIVTNYDNTCLYATLQSATSEEVSTVPTIELGGTDAFWDINNLNAPNLVTDPDGSILNIGTTAITNVMHYPNSSDGTLSFSNYIKEQIQLKNFDDFSFEEPAPGTLRIIRAAENISDTYVGALSWDTSGSYGPPTVSAISFTSHIWDVKIRNEISQYNGQVFNWQHSLQWVGTSPQHINGVDYYLHADYFDGFWQMPFLAGSGQNFTSDLVRDEPRIIVTSTGTTTWDGNDDLVLYYDIYSAGGHDNQLSSIEATDHNGHYLAVKYVNPPKVDGTGPYNAAEDMHDGDLVVSNLIDFGASIKIPTAIFGSAGAPIGDDGIPHGWYIMIPGDWTNSFSEGQTITIGGVEATANPAKTNALNISMVLSNINYSEPENMGGLGSTWFQFHDYHQTAGALATNWPYLIPWTTFNTITISQSSVGSIGSSNAGTLIQSSFYSITPKRHNEYTTSNDLVSKYTLGIDGQNGKAYSVFVEAGHDVNAYDISSEFKSQLEVIKNAETSQPFGVPDFITIERATLLKAEDANAQVYLTGNITDNSETIITVTDGINITAGNFIQIGGSISNNVDAEIVKVVSITNIAGVSRLEVLRAQMGTTAMTLTTTHSIFLLNIILQTNSSAFYIYGGDYRNIFTPNTLFKINTMSDINDENPWQQDTPSDIGPWAATAFSTYNNTSHYTTVVIDDTEISDDANVGNSFQGANSSYYMSTSSQGPLIQTSVLKVPGRLTSNTGLTNLSISGLVTRSLEIREFLNTEIWSEQTSNNIILETKSFDFGDTGQEVKIYKINVNAKHRRGSLIIEASIDGKPYESMTDERGDIGIVFNTVFTNKEIYFSDPTTEKKPVQARRVKIRIKGSVEGFNLNDMSITYRNKGLVG